LHENKKGSDTYFMKTTQKQIEDIKDMKAKISRELKRLDAKVLATSEARRLLPVGSSRARVTTANARWATACEARDRFLAGLERGEFLA
jgi:hypothetical protein